MIQAYDYIVKNWNKYGLNCSKNEFIALLNILEANNENLDSFHDVALNGYTEFMGIVSFESWDNDNDLMKTVNDFNLFFTFSDLQKHLKVKCEDFLMDAENENDFKNDFLDFINDLIPTHDGYVLRMWY